MKPYQRADAEADLQDALERRDLETARIAASWIDQLGPPPRATVLGAALWYAAHRIPVFPLQLGLKIPLPGSRGCLAASCDELEVREMFARPANIGIATGHVVDVLDFDGAKAHQAWTNRWSTSADRDSSRSSRTQPRSRNACPTRRSSSSTTTSWKASTRTGWRP